MPAPFNFISEIVHPIEEPLEQSHWLMAPTPVKNERQRLALSADDRLKTMGLDDTDVQGQTSSRGPDGRPADQRLGSSFTSGRTYDAR